MPRNPPYEARFSVGALVQIRDEAYLRKFQQGWRFHNNLLSEQLVYASQKAVVAHVSFYHGGDELYGLADVPGVWHGECLSPIQSEAETNSPETIVLLPGLDGTGELFDALVSQVPHRFKVIKVTLPPLSEYEQLFDAIVSQLPSSQFVLVAESFSGPIALRIATFAPERVHTLVLCNSFMTRPVTSLLRLLPLSLILSFRIPEWAVRYFLVGREASHELVESVQAAIARTPSTVLAARIRAVLSLPVASASVFIPARVLFLMGTHDRLINVSERSLNQLLPQAVFKRIRAPHLLLQTAPECAWAEIITFLATAG